jgi:putative RNA 2'-phosphotransferase
MSANRLRLSKFMSLVLRHDPGVIGHSIDTGGWMSIEDLVFGANRQGVYLTRESVIAIAQEDEKGRYGLSDDGLRIKATYGHSIEVDLGLDALKPPEHLFHGTATRFLNSIKQAGITRKRRRYVHLSADRLTAVKVGGRHGRPVILTVKTGRMFDAGFVFYRSESGIWLTGRVPPEYVDFTALEFPKA